LAAKVKEKTMANKKFWLGILVMVLVFGMTVVGCDNNSTDDTGGSGDTGGTGGSGDGKSPVNYSFVVKNEMDNTEWIITRIRVTNLFTTVDLSDLSIQKGGSRTVTFKLEPDPLGSYPNPKIIVYFKHTPNPPVINPNSGDREITVNYSTWPTTFTLSMTGGYNGGSTTSNVALSRVQ
jgi:hypothetical protein